jgi:hypothetical protein
MTINTDMPSWAVERALTKRQMVRQRSSRCDLCGRVTHTPHMHELVNRGRTPKNSVARQLSYQPELCAILCPYCHDKAHNTAVRNELFQRNYARYGYQAVKRAFKLLLDSLPTHNVGLQLPELEE